MNTRDVTFCSLNNEQKVVSHLSIGTDIRYLKAMFGANVDVDFNKSSVVFNIGYSACREHYNMLLGILLNYICSKYKEINEFYMITRGPEFLSLAESFGGKVLSANKENENIGNIYLLKFDFLKTISNPFIFSLIKDSNETYKKII